MLGGAPGQGGQSGALHLWHQHVGDQEVGLRFTGEQVERGSRGLQRDGNEAFVGQHAHCEPAEYGLVINDQDVVRHA